MKNFSNLELFRRIPNETGSKKGFNPNSSEAYFEKEPGDENEDVVLVDEIEDRKIIFTWNRKKSNDNIVDFGYGKGFSFYLARHVFRDPFFTTTIATDPENKRGVGIILNDENVMLVIDSELKENKIRIISAYYVDDTSIWSKLYWSNRRKNEFFGSLSKKTESDEEIERRAKLIEAWEKRRGASYRLSMNSQYL
jgi:uncharacterized DUF497 family protein